jgi:hypothetical protein
MGPWNSLAPSASVLRSKMQLMSRLWTRILAVFSRKKRPQTEPTIEELAAETIEQFGDALTRLSKG